MGQCFEAARQRSLEQAEVTVAPRECVQNDVHDPMVSPVVTRGLGPPRAATTASAGSRGAAGSDDTPSAESAPGGARRRAWRNQYAPRNPPRARAVRLPPTRMMFMATGAYLP